MLLCKDNEKHVAEIEPEYIKGITFRYVDKMSDVLATALGIEMLGVSKAKSNGMDKGKKGKKAVAA